MFDALKRWRRRRVLGRSALPDGLWAEAVEALPFVQELDDAERARLRDLVVLFLGTKSIVGAGGHEVTPLQRVVIAIQANPWEASRDGVYDPLLAQLSAGARRLGRPQPANPPGGRERSDWPASGRSCLGTHVARARGWPGPAANPGRRRRRG